MYKVIYTDEGITRSATFDCITMARTFAANMAAMGTATEIYSSEWYLVARFE